MPNIELWAHRGIEHGSTNGIGEPEHRPRFTENTVPALLTAALHGWNVEFDVLATADGYAVVAHGDADDRDILDNGTHALQVSEATLVNLQKFGLVARGTGDTELPPPLPWVLEALADHPVRMNIELKNVGAAQAVMQCLRRLGWANVQLNEHILISSFLPGELMEMRRCFGSVPMALLLHAEQPIISADRRERFIKEQNISALHVDLPLSEEGMVEWAADMGCEEGVRTYTVNDPAQAIELHARGIRGFFSDFPRLIGDALR